MHYFLLFVLNEEASFMVMVVAKLAHDETGYE